MWQRIAYLSEKYIRILTTTLAKWNILLVFQIWQDVGTLEKWDAGLKFGLNLKIDKEATI